MQDHIGLVERAQGIEGQQAGIAGAGAHQHHRADGGGGFLAQVLQQLALCVHALAATQQAQYRPLDQSVKEAAARGQIRQLRADQAALAGNQVSQVAPSLIEQGFNATAYMAGHHRRTAATGNGNLQRSAFHHGRNMEGGQLRIVHHVGEQAPGLGGGGHVTVDGRVVGGGDHQPDIGVQPLGIEFALQPLQLAGLQPRQQACTQPRCAYAGQGTGMQQGLGLALGDRSAPHHQHSPSLEVGKQRKQRGVQGVNVSGMRRP